MIIKLKDLYDFNNETGFVNDGHFNVRTKNGIRKIEAVDITAKNSIKLKIKTINFEIIVSPEHLLYNGKWIKSEVLKVDDLIDTINGYEKIISIEKDNVPEDLYDLQVSGKEFYANGIRSHNSSLLESIDFALFSIVRGKNSKRVPLYILPNRTNKNLETEIDFVNWNNDSVILNRKLNPKGFKISINNRDISEKYELMQQQEKDDIIGIEYNTYKSLVSLNLADFANFINLDTETKKKLLNKLFNIEEIDSYQSIAKELLKNSYKRKERLETTIISNENTIGTYKNNVQIILEKSGSDIDKKQIRKQIEDYKIEFIPLKNEIHELKEVLRQMNPDIRTKGELLNARRNKVTEDEFLLNELGKKIEIFQSGSCPFCGSVLTDDTHEKELHKLLKEYESAKKDLLEIKKNSSEIRIEVSGLIDERKNILNELNQKELRFDYLKDEIKELKSQYDQNIDSVSITELNKNIELLDNDNVKYNKSLSKLNEKIVNQEKLVDLLSEKGIRRGIIKTVVDPINEHLAKYLIELESKFNVKLDDSFDAIIKERYIDDIHVESLSTGEARKINVAIALSYMEMVISMNKKTNILFMDEVFASVDPENIDLMLKVLRGFSTRNKINVIIANHTTFDNAKFDRVISVEMVLGYSMIREN
jgi:DNA repair exonuclease SbcCD ATPase subunit